MAKNDEMKGSDFPLHAFPSGFQKIARESAEGLGFPLDFIAGSMMFAAGAAIGGTHCVRIKDEWDEYPLFYMAIVGRAGTNKSHPMSFAMKPLFSHDGEQHKIFKQHYAEYQQLMTLSKKEREEQGVTELPMPPHKKRFIVSDVTPEGLASIHEQNQRGLCLYVDELKSWINNFNRYNKGSEEQFWLSNFSGKPIIIDRRSEENSVFVSRSIISVIGSIQFMQLRDLAKGDRGYNGFLDRILFLIPRRLQKEYWSEDDVSPNLKLQWKMVMQELINMESLNDEFGERMPTTLHYTPDARKRLYEWQRHNTDLCNSEFDERLEGIYSKIEIYASRFALVLQLLRWVFREADKCAIDLQSVEGAIALAEYFRSTTYTMMDYVYGSELEKLNEAQRQLITTLPESFTTAEGVAIALRCGVIERSFKRFLKNEALFRRERHGVYTKII
ncbi:MAG: DUF3987 domain-containing protein [Rikenellaceae bacterium]